MAEKSPEEEEFLSSESETTEELFQHHLFNVDGRQDAIRIDKYLLEKIPNVSRTRIQALAKSGNIRVNDKIVKSNYKIRPKDQIAVVLPYPVRDIKLIPENIPISIVFEDEALAVVNKPSQMVVHPGYGNYTGTLVNALIWHFQELPQRKDYYGRPGLVHRLDKHTTGLLVVAKTEEALTHLARQFFERTTDRRYMALVWGDVLNDSGTITGSIGRSKNNRKVFQVFPDEEEYGKPAITHYQVLERFGYVTLVQCKLETGRTHQIRVHFRHIGHPVFNDLEYGGTKIIKGTTFSKYKQFIDNCFALLPGQALHARTLGFEHPETGKRLSFQTEPPEAFLKLLEKWRNYRETLSV